MVAVPTLLPILIHPLEHLLCLWNRTKVLLNAPLIIFFIMECCVIKTTPDTSSRLFKKKTIN